MLVSPIMGPVLSLTFGATLNQWEMAKIGLRNELISLVICIITGFIVGLVYTLSTKGTRDWPTVEMRNRGSAESLGDGAFIAFVSGIGVALSVSGDYLSAIIGVAISASLLPPAVNSGMLFAHAVYGAMNPDFQPVTHRRYTVAEIFAMSGWSFLLTIENIIIIFLVSLMMFKIKEVTKVQDDDKPIWKSVKQYKLKRGVKRAPIEAIQNVKRAIIRHNFYSYHTTISAEDLSEVITIPDTIQEEDQATTERKVHIEEIFDSVQN